VGAANYAACLARPHAHPFDMTGRPMTGWVMVSPAGCADEQQLRAWVNLGLTFARSLPPKV
jgi:hypothetical protein